MSTTTRPSEKGSAANGTESRTELIDEQTIRSLEDEHSDESGCRFAAVARSLEMTRLDTTMVEIPVTVVAYIDDSGTYAIERQFIGHRPDWDQIPRTAVVTDPSVVRKLPKDHRDRYAPVLEQYKRILSGADE